MSGDNSTFDFKLWAESLKGDLGHMMDQKLEVIHDRIDKVEADQSHSKRSKRRGKLSYHESDSSNTSEEEEEVRSRRNKKGSNSKGEAIKGLKAQIPSFQGRSDPDAYLEWEKKVDLIFDCHEYTDKQRMKLAVMAFSDYAIIWWDQITTTRRRSQATIISTWTELKVLMRQRFVSSHYHRDLYNKLQTLSQGSRSVEDYFKEMEMIMLRADIEEDREATMARFLNGLRPEIVDEVEMHHYIELNDMYEKALKVERRLKRRGSSKVTTTPTSSYNRNSMPRRDFRASSSATPTTRPR